MRRMRQHLYSYLVVRVSHTAETALSLLGLGLQQERVLVCKLN